MTLSNLPVPDSGVCRECGKTCPDAGDGSADFRDGLPGGPRRRKVCQHLYFGHRKRLSGGDAAKAESRGRHFRAWKAYRD